MCAVFMGNAMLVLKNQTLLRSCYLCVPWSVAASSLTVAICKGRLRFKYDGTRAETRFRLSAKRRSPFKSAGASVQSTTGSWDVRISGSNGSNAGYTMFRGSVKGTGYPLHSPFSPSLSLPCVTVCHHISTGVYNCTCSKPYGYAMVKKFVNFQRDLVVGWIIHVELKVPLLIL